MRARGRTRPAVTRADNAATRKDRLRQASRERLGRHIFFMDDSFHAFGFSPPWMTGRRPADRLHHPMTYTPIVSGRGLARYYKLGAETIQALHGVDVDVLSGDFIALKGPSGSGKSTLINLLGLLDRPDDGSVSLDGVNAATLSEDARADARRDRFGFIFQTFNLLPVLTAAENVGYPMTLKGRSTAAIHRRSAELLDAVGLGNKLHVRPDLLSGGQRQRVAIARALANEPGVIFADEPTANLDSHTADTILDLMRQLNSERGVAFVIATHDPRVVERARLVLALHDGQIAGAAT